MGLAGGSSTAPSLFTCLPSPAQTWDVGMGMLLASPQQPPRLPSPAQVPAGEQPLQ